ncbi:MAG: DDE-type integrase/transposase/recombinase [Atopobiaceae bacterium]
MKRKFHAKKPNKLWLTDITEFGLGCGKIYLSPIIDCFDGKVVSWSISQNPDAKPVSTMLDDAISVLGKDENPSFTQMEEFIIGGIAGSESAMKPK